MELQQVVTNVVETTKRNASTVPTCASNVAKKATLPEVVSSSVKKVVDELQEGFRRK